MQNLKEWLNTKTFEYKQAACMFGHSEWIEIPEGAVKFLFSKENAKNYHFANENNKLMSLTDINCGNPYWYGNAKNYMNQCKVDVLWQREQDEPFLTPESTLNDQYAEIEEVRQALKDNVNHPSHYADSTIECIDAMEAMMTPEQFIGYLRGNLFKYQWRYEKKNGIEDLKKAQWYLEKLTAKIAEKNAPF